MGPHPAMFNDYYWLYTQGSLVVVLGGHMGCHKANPGQPHARHVIYLLSYLASLKDTFSEMGTSASLSEQTSRMSLSSLASTECVCTSHCVTSETVSVGSSGSRFTWRWIPRTTLEDPERFSVFQQAGAPEGKRRLILLAPPPTPLLPSMGACPISPALSAHYCAGSVLMELGHKENSASVSQVCVIGPQLFGGRQRFPWLLMLDL